MQFSALMMQCINIGLLLLFRVNNILYGLRFPAAFPRQQLLFESVEIYAKWTAAILKMQHSHGQIINTIITVFIHKNVT